MVLSATELARLNTLIVEQRNELEQSQRFRQEYLAQQMIMGAGPRQVVQVSSNPLLFVVDDFCDADACRAVDNDANGCFHLMFPEMVADQLFQGQESEWDGLLFNTASSAQHSNTQDDDDDNDNDIPTGCTWIPTINACFVTSRACCI